MAFSLWDLLVEFTYECIRSSYSVDTRLKTRMQSKYQPLTRFNLIDIHYYSRIKYYELPLVLLSLGDEEEGEFLTYSS